MLVPTYNWNDVLASHYKKIPSIKRYYHFSFNRDPPRTVIMKPHPDTESKELLLLKNNWITFESGPDVIPPKGLSLDHQWYLFDQIRQFCPDGTKDLVCPRPSVPQDGCESAAQITSNREETSQSKRRKYYTS